MLCLLYLIAYERVYLLRLTTSRKRCNVERVELSSSISFVKWFFVLRPKFYWLSSHQKDILN